MRHCYAHKVKWSLPRGSALLALRPQASGPGRHLLQVSAAELCLLGICSVPGLHFGDSLSQPHNHTTHLGSPFLEMMVCERFIMGNNSQQNKAGVGEFSPNQDHKHRKQLTPFHQKNPVSKFKTKQIEQFLCFFSAKQRNHKSCKTKKFLGPRSFYLNQK